MQAVLDLLYRDTIKNLNDTLRFLDADELGHYCECEACLPRQEKELAALLSRERLEKYTDLLAERYPPRCTSGTTQALTGEPPRPQFGETQARCGPEIERETRSRPAIAGIHSLLCEVSPRKYGGS